MRPGPQVKFMRKHLWGCTFIGCLILLACTSSKQNDGRKVQNTTSQVPADSQDIEDGSQKTGNNNDSQEASSFASLVTETMFQQMFPNRNPFYSYEGIVAAADATAGFVKTGDLEIRKREAAAFLANTAHETGGLVYIEEIDQSFDYCDPNAVATPCAPGKAYFGRGPIQLSWNYNYGAAGTALNLPLLADPDLVARDPKVSWQTALWFWMTQSGAGSRTAHTSITEGHGFGETIRSINGTLECNGGNPAQVESRINYFQTFSAIIGVSVGDKLGC